MKLLKNVRLGPAIRMRVATVFVAVLACALVFLVASKATPAIGTPQSRQIDQNSAVPAARTDVQPSSSSRSGREALPFGKTSLPTRENLQLTLKTDCGNVEIFTDASNEVSYSVRPDPKMAGPEADALRRNSLLSAHNTPRGVVLIAPAATEGACRAPVIYEIHVPSRYGLNIFALQSGDITTQDIEGAVKLITGGGNIQVGSVRTRDGGTRVPARKTFTVQLETAGGNISVGDVAGALRAITAGGQISVHDVHGPAVLRTGGGDIHVGHVFGPARFVSGGGDIHVQKVDGGLWADTAGGRIEIGDAARATAFATQFPAGGNQPFPASLAPPAQEQQEISPISRLDITKFARLFDALVWGGIRVDPADQQKRLMAATVPEYPDVARWAGIEGDVSLRLFIGSDGTVRSIVPVSGPPVLARAAMRAVEQWRYAPALMDGHPVEIVTSVTLAFRLHP